MKRLLLALILFAAPSLACAQWSVGNQVPVVVANGGTNCTVATITCFNNITGFTAAGTTGTTSTNLVFSTSPSLTTPALGVATGTSLALNGATIGTNALALTGTANISGATTIGGALTYGGVALSNAVTGTGNMVLSASPTLTGTVAAAAGTFSSTLSVTGVFTSQASGTAGAPSITWSGDTTTGFYRPAGGTTAFSSAGVFVGQLTSTGINYFNVGASNAGTGAFTTLTATSGATISGAASSINASSNFTTSINTGTSTGAINIGNAGTTGVTSLLGLSTGTNADTLCLSSGGVVLLQAAACTISSKRFKHELGPLHDNALAAIKQVPVSVFTLKQDKKHPNRDPNAGAVQAGLYAEDIAKIMPKCALYENDMKTPKSYRQECVLAYLLKGEQQLLAKIDALTLDLAADDREIAELRRR